MDVDVESALKYAAKRDGVPVASKAAELLSLALSLEEDMFLASIADARISSKESSVSHESAWK